MRFFYPWVLLFIPPVVGFLIWLFFFSKIQLKATLKYSDLNLIKETVKDLPSFKKKDMLFVKLPEILKISAITMFLIALARPQSGIHERNILTEGHDIMIVLDVSESMRSEDFKPANRLEVAKNTIYKFIKSRPSDRIGLVVYAMDSFTQVPLTLDRSMLFQAVKRINFDIIDGSRTAIGMGLATAVSRLRPSLAKNRIVILLTDGANNSGSIDPLTAARLAEAYNIRVYTIGIGSKGKVPYPFQHPILGKQYRFIESDLDEDLLKEIAKITGGKFFRATDPETLEKIYDEINKLEKTKIKTKEYVNYDEIYQSFMAFGFVLLFISLILSRGVFMTIP